MDDAALTLLGIAIGAAATIVVGFGGALVSNLPAWTLERRQSKKESRDELRRLLSEMVPLATDYTVRVGVRSITENTEPMLRLLALRSQLHFVIPAKDQVLRPFLDQGIALLIKQGPLMQDDFRRQVAVSISEVLPGWFNDTMSSKEIAARTDSFAEALDLIKTGDMVTKLATGENPSAAPEA